MPGPRLQSIEVSGYTSISEASVELEQMNVLVGANGAGKSNFVRALEMLGRMADEELGLFVGLNGGASALLNTSAGATSIRLFLSGPPNSYEAVLVPASRDELIYESETVFFHASSYDRPWNQVLGKGHRESRLVSAAQDPRASRTASYTLEILRGCRVFHFHDTSPDAPVKQLVSTADNAALRQDAGNLAAFLLKLRDSDEERDQAHYRRILGAVRQIAPFFRDFVLEPERSDRIRLRWRQRESDAVSSADQLSDGTLRFICLATLLLQPNLPSLVALDEPELGLHPFAIVQLAQLLRQASERSQVLIATQSVTLIDQFGLDDLIVVERADGSSVFTRPDPDRLRAWLDDYSLGQLWEKNVIGGRPGARDPHRDR